MPAASARTKPSPRALKKPVKPRSLARFVRVLQQRLPELSAEYGIQSLGFFGSYVRHEAKRSSDLDILVELSEPHSFDKKLDLVDLLSDALGVKVEVIQKQSLPHYIGKRVVREIIWLQKDGVPQQVKLPHRKITHPNGKRNGAHIEPKREYLDYIQDMLDNMARVQRFVKGVTLEELMANDEKDFAVRYALQTIGEAANRIPADIRKMYSQLPWRKIIDLRNAMAHGYDRMVYVDIWKAIQESIPRDEPHVTQVLADEKKRRGVEQDENDKQEPTE